MPTYHFLKGERTNLPTPSPIVADFLERVEQAVADPAVDTNQVTDLIYGLENPIMDTTMVPGRAMITRAVLDNPVYHVLLDLLSRKRIQLGQLDMAAVRAAHTLTVPETARQLDITQAAVRAAIAARKLSAMLENGQWWIRPESVKLYKVSNRGPKKATKRRKARAQVVAKRKKLVGAKGSAAR